MSWRKIDFQRENKTQTQNDEVFQQSPPKQSPKSKKLAKPRRSSNTELPSYQPTFLSFLSRAGVSILEGN